MIIGPQCLGISNIYPWHSSSGKNLEIGATTHKQCLPHGFIDDASATFPPKSLKHQNACCTFLQVINLADITDRSGTQILPSSLQGIRHNDRRSYYMWPHQIRPSLEAWRTWHKTLCTQFCMTSASNRLQRPLGIWQHTGPLHQKWTFFEIGRAHV